MTNDTAPLETRPLGRLQTVLRATEDKYSGVVRVLENRITHLRGRARSLATITGILAAAMACLGAAQLAGDDAAGTRVLSGLLQLMLAVVTVVRTTHAYEDKLTGCETGVAWSLAALGAAVRTRDAYALAAGRLDEAGAAAFADLSLDMVRDAAARAEAAIPIM